MSGLNLDPVQLDRYSRHIIMDDVGPEGQQRLLDADVLVVGAGGLGAPVVQYLAAAGVGTLRIVDDDDVERSNLQRQIIHADADVGTPKAESASVRRAPEPRRGRPRARRAPRPVERRRAARRRGLRRGLLGQLLDALPRQRRLRAPGHPVQSRRHLPLRGPGHHGHARQRLLPLSVPGGTPEGTIPDCAEAGVLGVLPGTMGCVQATECVKELLGVGDLLAGRLLFYDAAAMSFEEVPVRPNPDCPVCGDDPEIDSVAEVNYVEGCAVRP